MGENVLEFKESHNANVIRNGLNQLIAQQKNQFVTDKRDLDWEIKLYEWILKQPDPEDKASAYLKARHQGRPGSMVNKRIVVKDLGWVIK